MFQEIEKVGKHKTLTNAYQTLLFAYTLHI